MAMNKLGGQPPRAITTEEAQAMLLDKFRTIAKYWADLPDKTPLERCEGTLFSILVTIDGGSIDLPAMDLVLRPHFDDKAFSQSKGQNWFPDGLAVNADAQLHELLDRNPKT